MKLGHLISPLPSEPLLHGFAVRAEHESSKHLIYFSVPACPGLAGLYNKRGWWQSSFPASVLLRVSLLGTFFCKYLLHFWLNPKNKGSNCVGWTGWMPPSVISMCIFMEDGTGFTSDFWQSRCNFAPQNGLENSVSLEILANPWFFLPILTWDQGSSFLQYRKKSQLHSHPSVCPSCEWQTVLDHQQWQRPPYPTGTCGFETRSHTAKDEHTYIYT